MLLKLVPGAKVPASTDNMGTFVWYVMAREVCWSHNLHASARIAMAQERRCLVNFKIAVKFAEGQAGHTYLKTHLPHIDREHAARK